MTIAVVLAALGGLFIATALVVYVGAADVGHALTAAGWSGLAAVCLAHLGYWALCAQAWRVLLPALPRRSGATLLWARWVRDAGSDLLPISSVGGDLMGARSAALHGLPGAQALGSTVVDVTAEMAAQLVFTVVGLMVLLAWPARTTLATTTLIGLAVAAPLTIAFVVAQRIGLFLLIERAAQHLASRWRWTALGAVDDLHGTIARIYRDRRRVAASVALHLVGWLASAAEAWLALTLLGAAPGVLVVLVIESLAYALRSAAFVVPAAIGVQEGGYVVLGPLFGLPPDVMLALSLLKRARDLALGVPALLVWQWIEGRRWRSVSR